MDFLARLRKAVQFCKFDGLKSSNDPTEEMILLALIAGLESATIKEKVLDRLQGNEAMSVAEIVEYVQHMEQLKDFVNHRSNVADTGGPLNTDSNGDIHFQNRSREIKNCTFCGSTHPVRKCLAFGKTCSTCGKVNHFAKVCRSKTFNKQVHAVDDMDKLVLFLSQAQSLNSIECKLQNLMIDKHPVSMQIDTGASCTVISSTMWQKMGKPKLSRCSKTLEAYDGHTMRTLGKFTAVVEIDDKYVPADIIVIDSRKSFGLLGCDLLENGNSAEGVHSAEMSETAMFLPVIKGVTAKMDLVDGARDVFCRARPVPVVLL